MMHDETVVLEHSLDVDVSVDFAWAFRTDIATWSDPPATFTLDGPFASGSGGTTLIPGQEPLRWRIRDVVTEQTFTIEMPLDGAAIAFEWRFEALSARRTRLTQRITLSGDQAARYEPQVTAGFGPTLQSGMTRLGTEMLAAERARG